MSSRKNNSILDLNSLDNKKIDRLFSFCDRVASGQVSANKGFGKTAALLFFEASTRTRLSFETACVREGVYPLRLDGKSGTSLEKGETLEDTVLNVDAMNPSFHVIRCGEDLDLEALAHKVKAPILNAGWGKRGHPSQALLDAYTIRKNLGSLQNKKVLIIGDLRHSRVAASHFELAEKMKYEIAVCGPQEFIPANCKHTVFTSLSEGLKWADVAMALRVQSERHENKFSVTSYREQYGLTSASIKDLSGKALIMHPGPINQGVELDSEVLADSRCQVLDQVSNGVLIRQGLVQMAMNGEDL